MIIIHYRFDISSPPAERERLCLEEERRQEEEESKKLPEMDEGERMEQLCRTEQEEERRRNREEGRERREEEAAVRGSQEAWPQAELLSRFTYIHTCVYVVLKPGLL